MVKHHFIEHRSNSNIIFRTSNELEHQFSNIIRCQTCSSIDDRTRIPYFWLPTIKHRTSNLIGPSLDILYCLLNRLEHFFQILDRFYLKFCLLIIKLEHPIRAQIFVADYYFRLWNNLNFVKDCLYLGICTMKINILIMKNTNHDCLHLF